MTSNISLTGLFCLQNPRGLTKRAKHVRLLCHLWLAKREEVLLKTEGGNTNRRGGVTDP